MNSPLQIVLVLTSSWDAVTGYLTFWERETVHDEWVQQMKPIPVVVGKKGMVWANVKKEGDLCTPAGAFSLGSIFGDTKYTASGFDFPFVPITEDLVFVDDPKSISYNQFATKRENSDWASAEHMSEVGPLYELGLVIEHNMHPIVPGAGSAIFLHVWRNPESGTAGCTAMAKDDLLCLLAMLKQDKSPELIQLPIAQYNIQQKVGGLPILIKEGWRC